MCSRAVGSDHTWEAMSVCVPMTLTLWPQLRGPAYFEATNKAFDVPQRISRGQRIPYTRGETSGRTDVLSRPLYVSCFACPEHSAPSAVPKRRKGGKSPSRDGMMGQS